MALQLWETLKEAIVAYTGLSPATFFTVLALGLALYYVISGFFASSDNRSESRDFAEVQPLPPPVQLGEISEEELKQYDGSDSNKPLLMAIKSQIYDVSQSRMFYGPGGPYAFFAGKDASRALAKMSFEEKDLTGDISGLGPFELEALQDWEYKFMSKYVKVGTIQKPVAESEEAAAGEAAESTNAEVSKPTEDTPSESPAYKTEETPGKFGMSMTRIFICYGGEWDANGNMYIGGNTKGIAISKSITYEDFLVRVYTAVRIDHEVFDIKIKCIYKLLIDSPPCDINDDEDLNFFLMGEDASVLPLYISTVPKDVISERNIQFNPYIASGSGSNHVASV